MPETPDPPALTSTYGQLLDLLTESPDVDAFLDEMVRLAARVTPAAACSITTVHRDGQPFATATSDDLATQVDEIQYGTDEGPRLDALRTGTVVYVDDMAGDERWDRYRPHAIARGVLSSLSLPLAVDGHTVAGLNLYSGQRAAFNGAVRHQAEVFAAQCAAALTLTLRQAHQAQVQRQLGEAMTSRVADLAPAQRAPMLAVLILRRIGVT